MAVLKSGKPATRNAPGPTQLSIVKEAAEKFHIPTLILWGVYGVETSHGSNVTTSSTGAKGAFQFEPETAKAYSYPYTNQLTPEIFREQAEAAAHYLSDLYHAHKNWNGALYAYSGGGYGLSQVEAQAKQGLGGLLHWLNPSTTIKELETGEAQGPFKGLQNSIIGSKGPLQSSGEILAEWFGEPLKPVKLIGGGFLLYLGLRSLTRTSAGATVVTESKHQAVAVTAPVRVAKRIKRPTGGSA